MTAVDPRNVLARAKEKGYTPVDPVPAEVVADTITADLPVVAATTVPAGTKFLTAIPGVYYETTEDFTIPINGTQGLNIPMKQWESWTLLIEGTGETNQRHALLQPSLLLGTVVVTINGVEWTRVDNFVESTSTDTHYMIVYDFAGTISVLFGDGTYGALVPEGVEGTIFYRTGGGRDNSIAAGQLHINDSEIRDAGNQRLMTLTAFNSLDSVPGTDAETLDQIKMRAISKQQSPTALMTKNDVYLAVSAVTGVEDVNVVNWQDVPSLPKSQVIIAVKPENGGTIPNNLATALNTLLTTTRPLIMGWTYTLVSPTYKKTAYRVDFEVAAGYSRNVLYTPIRNMFNDIFVDAAFRAKWGLSFGFGVTLSIYEMQRILSTIPGVKRLWFTNPLQDVEHSYKEYPDIDSLIIVGESGGGGNA